MIDWKRISELRAEIGVEEFDEVVELFLEEVDGVISRLRTDPRPELFEEDLHFLKGCSLNLGFSGLATLCLRGERAAADGDAESVNLQEVFDCYDASKSEFFHGVASGRAA